MGPKQEALEQWHSSFVRARASAFDLDPLQRCFRGFEACSRFATLSHPFRGHFSAASQPLRSRFAAAFQSP